MIAVSIVSHAHGSMVSMLTEALLGHPEVAQLIVTLNVPETIDFPADARLLVIYNKQPKGFGANHNAAFKHCRQPYFCPLNPDIALSENPFPTLLACLQDDSIALAAPLIVSPEGEIEDSARHFPTLASLLRKALRGDRGCYPAPQAAAPFFPDWVAGMFMLFKAAAYRDIGGFDEAYFLYYEDADICWRIRTAGLRVAVCPVVRAVHDARRASRRSLRHMRWHLSSMLRFLLRRVA